MNTYQYQILRYLPDRVSGEFVNLGVVVYSPEEQILNSRFYKKSNRLHAFFPSANTRYIMEGITAIDAAIHRQRLDIKKLLFINAPLQLNQLTKTILPPDDSALFFTDTFKTLDIAADNALNDLFERFVLKHVQATDESDSIADSEVRKQKQQLEHSL